MTMSFLLKKKLTNLLIPKEIPRRSENIDRIRDCSFAAKRPQKIDTGTSAKFDGENSWLAAMSRSNRFEYDCIV